METVKRIFRFGFHNYVRNGWLSMATTLVLALTLFIVAVFTLNTYVIRLTTKSVQDKLDMAVYINDSPSEEEVGAFVSNIKAYPEVREVIYLNKEQVIAEWNKLTVDSKIKSQVNEENNPLPRTIKIKAHDPAMFDAIDAKVKEADLAKAGHIRKISYGDNRPVIQQLVAQSKKTIRNGIIVSGIFIFISVIFVYNTIRLIIRFRQEEIGIMKLVGATDSFVRGPFLIEGAMYGIIAGLITMPALYLYIRNGLPESTSIIASPNDLVAQQLLTFFMTNMYTIGAVLVAVAITITVCCSFISVHHHLKR
jgi:cell division transport system permease protein